MNAKFYHRIALNMADGVERLSDGDIKALAEG